jgi:hypothetical protein
MAAAEISSRAAPSAFMASSSAEQKEAISRKLKAARKRTEDKKRFLKQIFKDWRYRVFEKEQADEPSKEEKTKAID